MITAAGDVALSGGAFWTANEDNTGIKPGSDDDEGTWELWTLSDFDIPAYGTTYPQGTPVTGSLGGLYVVTSATGASQDPDIDSTGYTLAGAYSGTFVSGQVSAAGQVVIDDDGSEWIWPSRREHDDRSHVCERMGGGDR